jgi:hypothetical protein
MGLTLLAIPFLILGVFVSPYSTATQRCLSVKIAGPEAYCFALDSKMPETIKYGAVAAGFLLIYAGRRQLKRRRDGK